MVKSMTGYGKAEVETGGYNVTVELRAVNHRYFEFSCRTPRGYGFLDDKLKSYVSSRVGRGKVDAYVSIEFASVAGVNVEINREYADGYVSALKSLSKIYDIDYDVSVSSLLKNQEIFSVKKANIDEEAAQEALLAAAEVAVDKFIEARSNEGVRMADDIKEKCNTIISLVDEVEKLSVDSVKLYRENLEAKIKELLNDVQIDEQRILTETAIFADKVAIDEETVRLKSHIKELINLLDTNEPVGRKLDFIVQEMNREANTMGSKSQDIAITRNVVDIKANIEKIREQIQNIE